MAQHNVVVRNYREEDLPSLVALCEDTLAENPHFACSTLSLKHSISSPSVSEDGVFVAETNGKTTGFAIVSISTEPAGLKQANIIELQTREPSSLNRLIEAILHYCNRMDVDAIVVVQPVGILADTVFKGWLRFDTGVMMGRALSLPSLIHALLSVDKIKNSFAGREVVFNIGSEAVVAGITAEGINIVDSGDEPHLTAAELFSSADTFLRIVLGRLNPYMANMTGMIRVKGLRNTLWILRLLRMMKIERPFYTSLGDRM